MPERISTPHELVAVHGTGRLADGHTVKRPAPPVQPDHRLHRTILACLIVVALAVAIGVLR